MERWLAQLGFQQGNPFASVEAGKERQLLPRFFVDVEGYARIKEARTVIVFAPRGGGKSALRIMLASESAPIKWQAQILAVEYVDFDMLLHHQRQGQILNVQHHVSVLLKLGLQALLDALCGPPGTALPSSYSRSEFIERSARLQQAPAGAIWRLAQLLRQHHPGLLAPEHLFSRFQTLEEGFSVTPYAFREAVEAQQLRALVQHEGPSAFLALLVDLPVSASENVTPTAQMQDFAGLAGELGYTSVQFLVDRLDEMPETADNPQVQAELLEPLLAHLPVLEMPGVAFKFFLSREARDVLLKRPKIRRDRLSDEAVTVRWSPAHLKQLLDERLQAYSEDSMSGAVFVHDLTEICQSSVIGKEIEQDILKAAYGSPRRLLIAGQLLLEAHLRRSGPAGKIIIDDWDEAKKALMKKMPPLLRLQLDRNKAFLGDREVALTSQQHQILQALVDAGGYRQREDLIEAVWDTKEGVTDEAVHQAIKRLRAHLGDDQSNPNYLITVRGQGFTLAHYEVE